MVVSWGRILNPLTCGLRCLNVVRVPKAPGLELVADNRRQIHETGTHGAWFDWTVGPELVEKIAQDRPVVCPYFQPGDAIFFDHYCLHRTAEGPNDTLSRFALESWFFAESRAPAKQQPVLF